MCAFLGRLGAMAAEVVSSNIVGYEKINLAVGYNMVGPQFKLVGADTTERDIASIGTLESTMAGYGADYVFANIMEVWDPATKGYIQYGWSGTSGTDVDDDPSYDNQWLDSGLEKTEDTIALGNGAWIKAATAGSITIAGEVPTAATTTVQLSTGYNIVANPYPGEVAVASFGALSSSMAGYGSDYVFATIMEVWDPETKGYTQYGWSGTSGTDVDDDSSYDNQWLDSGLEKTTDTIPFGTAVWIKAASEGSITFTSPVAE